jgi:hypothetical protein
MKRMTGTLAVACTCGCLVGLLSSCDDDESPSPNPHLVEQVVLVKDRICADDLIAYCNASIIERLCRDGKDGAPRPMAIDCIRFTFGDRRGMRLFAYDTRGDIDSYSVYFRNREGKLCEIVREIAVVGLRLHKLSALLEEVPLSRFDDYGSLRVIDSGRKLVVPQGIPLAIALHAQSGAMSNAVLMREVVTQPSTKPSTQESP